MAECSERSNRRLCILLLAVGIPYVVFLERSIAAEEPPLAIMAIIISVAMFFLAATLHFLRQLGRADVHIAARELKAPHCDQCGQRLPDRQG